MSNINKFECILCQNIAEYDFSCHHHLCKTCYKIENFCIICNTKNIEIKQIKQNSIYCYDIYPELHQPSGYVNLSRLSQQYNILRVMNGMSRLEYST